LKNEFYITVEDYFLCATPMKEPGKLGNDKLPYLQHKPSFCRFPTWKKPSGTKCFPMVSNTEPDKQNLVMLHGKC